jgi:hypothetical protein
LEKVTKLCRFGSKVEDEKLKKSAKQPSLKTQSPPHLHARSPRFELSCQK